MSRALSDLKQKKLVEVLNPKKKVGRIYQKTTLGKKLEKSLAVLEPPKRDL